MPRDIPIVYFCPKIIVRLSKDMPTYFLFGKSFLADRGEQ